jgi:hypothetical protein
MEGVVRSFLAAAAASAALAAAAPAAAQPAPARELRTAEALAEDARLYAGRHQVPLGVAIRRLRAQEESVAATDRIAEAYRHRLAGIAIEHDPEYRIVVLLTGEEPAPAQSVFAGGMAVPIVFRTGAKATRERIVAAIREKGADIRAALPAAQGMGADPRTGELVVMLRAHDARRYDLAEVARRIEEGTGVPARVRLLDGPVVDADIEGGGRVVGADAVTGRRTYCTTGFVVTDGARTGIVTAAHCPDEPTYFAPDGRQVALSFGGQWGWSFQDVQLHVSDEAQRPVFYADTAKTEVRTLTGSRGRSGTRAGDAVCHRGETTGYSCSLVELTDYSPPGDLCGGPCDPVWVTVAGPSCRGGDSGGPVFSGTTAFGIVKGATYTRDGRCSFYFYMSTDYLPDGWRLLKADSDEAAQRMVRQSQQFTAKR